MKQNKTKLSLVARLVGGTMFVAVLMFNLVSLVQTDAKGLSFQTLKAYAQSGGSGNEEEGKGSATKTTVSGNESSFWFENHVQCSKTRTVETITCSGTGTTSCTPSTTNGDWSAPSCGS